MSCKSLWDSAMTSRQAGTSQPATVTTAAAFFFVRYIKDHVLLAILFYLTPKKAAELHSHFITHNSSHYSICKKKEIRKGHFCWNILSICTWLLVYVSPFYIVTSFLPMTAVLYLTFYKQTQEKCNKNNAPLKVQRPTS